VPAADAEAKALKLIRSIAHQHKATRPRAGAATGSRRRGPVGRAGGLAALDKLPETDRTQVERMVVYEADRFID